MPLEYVVRPDERNKKLRQPTRRSTSLLTDSSAQRRHKPDYLLLILAVLLSVIGLIVVYSISPALAIAQNVSDTYYVVKQITSIGLGLVAFAIFSALPIRHIARARVVFIVLALVAAAIVQLFGEEVNGASRWIQIGGLSFQVAELIKFTLIVWVGSFLVERMRDAEMDDFKATLRPLLIALLVVGVVVAGLESDLGSTAVMVAIMGMMTFAAGLPLKRIALVVAVIAIGLIIAVGSTPYRRDRVATFLNPTSDCQDTGYQACQALIAVGSGGIFGLGLGNSVQAYGYLPEAANDSIFAVYAEKFGFLGVSIVLGLYVALFARIKRLIDRTADGFSRLFVIGFLAWLSTQTIINIGAMMGLLPLKGITLPFISYGGTSILFIMAALGVVFHISRFSVYEPIRNSALNTGGAYDHRPMRGRVGRTHYTARGRRT